ncbi:hypothetical protein [Nocardioides conyzicola]|uniref:Uncharacterized protein n=1 Tax=Nocardioides conyzicola TaxID=1651781 RepID=A0ABP8WKP7_9ACTN
MSFDDDAWAELLASLNRWSTASEPRAGRIEVTAPRPDGSTTSVTIVMTPGEWSDLVSIMYGASEVNVEAAAHDLRALVLSRPPELGYLVYADYRLVPSATPGLPVDPDQARLDELSRQHPGGIPGGGWSAHRPARGRPRADGGT